MKIKDYENYLNKTIKSNNLLLSFNGIIYNINELNEFLNENYEDYEFYELINENSHFNNNNNNSSNNNNSNIDSNSNNINTSNNGTNDNSNDGNNDNTDNKSYNINDNSLNEIILINLINHYIKNNHDLLESIKKAMKLLNGDYVFSVEDSENLAIVRDPIGAKPLYFEILSEKTGLSSTYNQIAIGKSRKTLWKHGISNPKTLIPGNIIYNNKIIENSYFIENIHYPLKKAQKKHFDPNKVYKKEFYKNNLKKLLEKSVKMRIKDLNKVGIIFSGGIDSTIIAKIIKDISKESKIEVKLYTVGTENSKDIEFSEKIAKDLDLPLKTQVITKEIIENNLKNLLITIEEADIVKIGVGMTIHLSTKLAKEDGRDVVLSGQGADELFGGYHRYLKTFEDKGEIAIANELKHDIENMYHVNLERDIPIAISNGIEMRSPFLDPDFIDLALNIPIKYKIKSYDDNLRKHILREIGEDLAIPDYVVNRPKKAAQYGSGIHKILSKKILKEFDYKLFLKELKNSYLASE